MLSTRLVLPLQLVYVLFFFFQAEDGIRDFHVTGVQTCALPIYLIDVTPIAQSVGLPVPVCLSKPLWDFAITASHTLPDEEHESRVRDVLIALRLRLATIPVASPAMEFPALLPFPPEPVPQLCPLYAIAMGDAAVPYSITILLANEVSAVIRPTGN